MTLVLDTTEADHRRARRVARAARIAGVLETLGLGFLAPLVKALAGDDPAGNLRSFARLLGIPLIAIALFLLAWGQLAPRVQTSLGALPGPGAVWEQAVALHGDYLIDQQKRAEFHAREAARNAELAAAGKPVKTHAYTGAPTFYAQIWTSIRTVLFGFAIATLFAVPVGILCGLSPTVNLGLTPLIQIFKPVSPLAWLPIVTMVVSALYHTTSGGLPKSFLVSAITVTLCSLWPTLINTGVGVASIDKDLLNVSRVLRLSTWTKITKLVLPSALPLIFTGLRLSLGVGWMVLIAAEMLAQNPGLGKFVWDEFQNGSSNSLARIMVAVLTIGIIGFLLDRIMFAIQSAVSTSTRR
ncbi:ABC transporter permease [Amaricoccus solimangrovi]|uniref:ABC transporter permease n=1 Tax=Amaricoccus solimangrovi TaxID=2589815 RepID=A0A501X083_9RHOB|nr:ABC transporter permease [Amaricoccus solimangrovi]TPE53627.1 ABC transporter permease [Amaricoccus solimangrovi]